MNVCVHVPMHDFPRTMQDTQCQANSVFACRKQLSTKPEKYGNAIALFIQKYTKQNSVSKQKLVLLSVTTKHLRNVRRWRKCMFKCPPHAQFVHPNNIISSKKNTHRKNSSARVKHQPAHHQRMTKALPKEAARRRKTETPDTTRPGEVGRRPAA